MHELPSEEHRDIGQEAQSASYPRSIVGDSMTSDMAGGIACGMKTCLYLRHSMQKIPANSNSCSFASESLEEIGKYLLTL